MKKISGFLLTLFLLIGTLQAQTTDLPFWKNIQAFYKQDSIKMPEKGQILFIGSSSFTNWKDVQDYFPGYTIINRGFGGSRLTDQLTYVSDMMERYRPRQVVVYCGENDLTGNDNPTADSVYNRFVRLMKIVRNKKYGKKLPVVYISIKPSPARIKFQPQMVEANRMIKTYLAKQKKAVFVDVAGKMFNADGTVMPEIFGKDSLHMNAKGYAIWQKEIAPVLSKDR